MKAPRLPPIEAEPYSVASTHREKIIEIPKPTYGKCVVLFNKDFFINHFASKNRGLRPGKAVSKAASGYMHDPDELRAKY